MIDLDKANRYPLSTRHAGSRASGRPVSTACRDPEHGPSSTGAHPLPRAVSRETEGACGKPVWITFLPVGRCPQTADEGCRDCPPAPSFRCCAARPSSSRWFLDAYGHPSIDHRPNAHLRSVEVPRTGSAGTLSTGLGQLCTRPTQRRAQGRRPLVQTPSLLAARAQQHAPRRRSGRRFGQKPVSPSAARLANSAMIDTSSPKSGCPATSDTPTSVIPSRSCCCATVSCLPPHDPGQAGARRGGRARGPGGHKHGGAHGLRATDMGGRGRHGNRGRGGHTISQSIDLARGQIAQRDGEARRTPQSIRTTPTGLPGRSGPLSGAQDTPRASAETHRVAALGSRCFT